MANRPTDIELPQGWTWERVETERAKWDISETMVPVAVVPGACVAWCTINSVRCEAPLTKAEQRSWDAESRRKGWHS